MPYSACPVEEHVRAWGKTIKVLREALGLSQEDLAKIVEVQQSSVARWEAGISAPRDKHKLRLAEALHTDVRVLFPLFNVKKAS